METSIDANATVAEATRLMREQHVDRLVVVRAGEDGGVPVGTLSAGDIIGRVMAVGLDPRVMTAGDVVALSTGAPN
jgi:CBS domain-containing protein